MHKFPILYKKTATGAIQFWEISVDEVVAGYERTGGRISTTYGQVGTNSPQCTSEVVTNGKNQGRVNATTAYMQALKEAESRWKSQKKSGYVESVEGAEAEDRDTLITGGIDPMLAQSYADLVYDLRPGHELAPPNFEKTKDASKIQFPCYVQPKLDGIRCIAVLKDGDCTLWTRTRKPITSCPHIQAALVKAFPGKNLTLDGELYTHALKDDFESIVSAVRKAEPTPEAALVQYHIYDLVDLNKTFHERLGVLYDLFTSVRKAGQSDTLVQVFTNVCESDEDAKRHFEFMRDLGYEGAMLRNKEGRYRLDYRSCDLQKFKPFHDDEFEIVGFTEGRGKLAGKLGTWVCKTKSGATFETSMNGPQATLTEYFQKGSEYVGKLLTVRYQGITGTNEVPRLPKGRAIRNYE